MATFQLFSTRSMSVRQSQAQASLWRSWGVARAWSSASPLQRDTIVRKRSSPVSSFVCPQTKASAPSLFSPFSSPLRLAVRFSTTVVPGPPNGPPRTPLHELERMRDMVEKLNKTNKAENKRAIIREYPDLTHLLVFIYDPHVRFHINSTTFETFLDEPSRSDSLTEEDLALIDGIDLASMLRLLNERQVTGMRSRSLLSEFLERAGVRKARMPPSSKLDVMTVFLRILDRNLKAGIKQKTIQDAMQGAELPDPLEYQFMKPIDRSTYAQPKPSRMPKSFDVALGKAYDANNVGMLFEPLKKWSSPPNPTGAPSWFMSRKLDGIRCIFEVDVQVDEEGKILGMESVRAVSRTNRELKTLSKLTSNIGKWVTRSSTIRAVVQRALEERQILSGNHPHVARFFLDGEVCVLVPETKSETSEAAAARPAEQDGNDNQRYVEDFSAIAKLILRKGYTIETPAYFPFDLLTYDEFYFWHGDTRKHEVLGRRLERVAGIVEEFQQLQREDEERDGGAPAPLIVRKLQQTRVTNAKQVEDEFRKSAEQKWEGLILRRDCLYVGKRSSAILKLKFFQDAEYEVKDIEVSTMRLSVGKEYAERRALASVLIEHKGTSVNVGSGFSAEQRIRYAENPNLIIGKQITVAYFAESRASSRKGENEYSLRFPLVKAVFEEGRRDF